MSNKAILKEDSESLAKRRSLSPAAPRGVSQASHSVAASDHTAQRVLAVKLEFDWKKAADKTLFQRLRDLSWQAARYRNGFIRRIWAEAMGWRIDPDKQDKHDVTKQGRQ